MILQKGCIFHTRCEHDLYFQLIRGKSRLVRAMRKFRRDNMHPVPRVDYVVVIFNYYY